MYRSVRFDCDIKLHKQKTGDITANKVRCKYIIIYTTNKI